jgi:uncharacterized protein (DUF2141 family)
MEEPMIRSLLAAALIAAAPLPALARPGGALSVHFANVKEARGAILVAIYDETGWSGGKPIRVATVAVTGDAADLMVEGLAPGSYGIKAFHDADGDGKMGTNPFGIPTEQFGFSRDAIGDHGVPAWADAAFEVTAAGAVQTITLR